jgi:competence protein ComEC
MPQKRSLTILDVGHGNCAVLVDSKGVLAIDAGAGSTLLEYLSARKIVRIDVLIISHADRDHIGGLVGLLAAKTVEVSRVCLNSDSTKGTEAWDDLLFVLNQEDLKGRTILETSLVRDDSGKYDQGDVHMQIVAPGKYLAGKGVNSTDRHGRKIRSNSLSAVIRLTQDKRPVALLPGDLDEIGIDDMISDKADAHAPFLVFPHHGGAPGAQDLVSFVRKLCQTVAPSVVVFSVARGRPKHPLPAVFTELRKNLKTFRIACTQLSEHCAKETPSVAPVHLVDAHAQGREKRKCCAGTLILDLEHPDALLPSDAEHQAFITAHAPTALCRR